MNDITFEQAWNYGGPLMWVLALFSVWALALMIYLWYSQRAGIVIPEAVSRICASKDPESEGGRVADRLMSQVEWLADLGAIAPLVGLLGTVLGMFQAFGGIASDVSAGAKPMVLAQGVSQAIVTTIFGLVVAIPSLLAYAFFRRRAQRRIAEVEERVIEHFASISAEKGSGMKFKKRSQSKATAFALTSMLDVIFLLLCFFVTVSVFSQWESEISIKLPNAKTAETPERLPGEIIVNLAKDGKITVNSASLSLGDLGARLAKVAKFYPGQPVIIRADKEVRYEALVELIDTCRAAGIWNFSLATDNSEGRE